MSILDSFKLDGKVALVTGARQGLGQGMAMALAEAGADIVGLDWTESGETGEIDQRTRTPLSSRSSAIYARHLLPIYRKSSRRL